MKNSKLFEVEFLIIGVCVATILTIVSASLLKKTNNIVTKDVYLNTIYSEFIESNFDNNLNLFIADDYYSIVSYDWVNNTGKQQYNKFLVSLNMHKWSKNSSDCDDFSKAFTVFIKAAVRKIDPSRYTPAVGEVYYYPDSGGNHALNIIFTYKDNDIVISFFDSTKNKFVDLTTSEIESIYYVSL